LRFISFSIYKISGNITQVYQKYIFGIAHLHSGLTISSARRPLSGIRLRTGTPVRYTIMIIIRIEDLEHQSRFFHVLTLMTISLFDSVTSRIIKTGSRRASVWLLSIPPRAPPSMKFDRRTSYNSQLQRDTKHDLVRAVKVYVLRRFEASDLLGNNQFDFPFPMLGFYL
jgi:hypothetical protein